MRKTESVYPLQYPLFLPIPYNVPSISIYPFQYILYFYLFPFYLSTPFYLTINHNNKLLSKSLYHSLFKLLNEMLKVFNEQRQLVDNIFKQSSNSSTVPYFVRDFRVSNKRNIINLSTFWIDDEMIFPHGLSSIGERSDIDSVDYTNTEIITRNNRCGVIINEWEKLKIIASNALL
ncbi:hypothetical protein H8356DRAFT_1346770 [Neocallimastix lanati (nom. inval.)]|nr:hypothetical protein H8356DRAFT_1346770 [Neocallimastix sp. JGI-2020a]